jgi:polyisoprenyl-phosphate glycosyltransferase
MSEDQPDVDVSVVLPIHNERGHLGEEIKRIREALESSHYSFEIIAVDDGSTDGSTEELVAIDGIRLIRSARNRGTGSARRTGTRAARGRVVVWTDVDMTYPNERIPQLVKEMEGFDQVVGARTSEQGSAKLLRRPAKWFIRKLASYLTDTDIPDLNSGFRAFRRDVGNRFLHMLPDGFSCVTTMTMAFLTNGYSVHYVPIDYFPRAGQSKFHWRKDTARYLNQVTRMVLTWNPLRVFMPVGLTLMAIGAIKLGYDLAVRDFHVATNTLLVLFAALQIFSVGLLADLVVRLSKRSDDDAPLPS